MKHGAGPSFIFFGSLASAVGINSLTVLAVVFLMTTFIYFVYVVFKMSRFMTMTSMIGLIVFEIIVWSALVSIVIYIVLKLYNGVMASLPFIENNTD